MGQAASSPRIHPFGRPRRRRRWKRESRKEEVVELLDTQNSNDDDDDDKTIEFTTTRSLDKNHVPSIQQQARREKKVCFNLQRIIYHNANHIIRGRRQAGKVWYSEADLKNLQKRLILVDAKNLLKDRPPAKEWWKVLTRLRRESMAAIIAHRERRNLTKAQLNQLQKQQESRLLARAKMTVMYQQVDDLVGIERLLLSWKADNDKNYNHNRQVILDFMRRYPNQPETIADYQQRISLPYCQFARELALAQEDALRLSETTDELRYPDKGPPQPPSIIV